MVRQRPSSGEWCLSLADFRRLDFGQVCQYLGLRPSQPYSRADGTRAPRRRRRHPR